MITDIDVHRAAWSMIRRFGDDAETQAAMRGDALLDRGDLDPHRRLTEPHGATLPSLAAKDWIKSARELNQIVTQSNGVPETWLLKWPLAGRLVCGSPSCPGRKLTGRTHYSRLLATNWR
jgi:hypothetical protein